MAANETSIDTRDWSLLGLHSVLWGGSLASSLRLPCGCLLLRTVGAAGATAAVERRAPRHDSVIELAALSTALAYIVFFQILRRSYC